MCLYYGAFAGLLIFSWWRSKSLLHPHFVFCAMLCVFASDFMIRGFDDANLDAIPLSHLYVFQLTTLFIMVGSGFAAALIRKPYEVMNARRAGIASKLPPRTGLIILIGASIVLGTEILKRMIATQWSLGDVLEQMFGPRGYRDWDVMSDTGRNNAVFQLISAILPLAAVSFSFLLVAARGTQRIIAVILLALSMFILVTDGSRTPVVVTIAAAALFAITSTRSNFVRISAVLSSAAAIAALTSIMILNRSSGYEDLNTNHDFTLVYHQDDSLYRAWSAYYYSEARAYFWNVYDYFFYIFTMPIPRSLWPNKPLLDQDFYGQYKLYYVTNTFMGEWVAMLGPTFGSIASFFTSLGLYRLLYSAQRIRRYPLGDAAYLLIALYIYMSMRSLANLTGFMYAPLFAVGLVLAAHWFSKKGDNQPAMGLGA